MPVSVVQIDKDAAALAAMTDELLFVEIQRGSGSAFEHLVRRYEVELYCYLARYLGDAALAEDVFQNTFLQVHQKRQSFDSERRVRPWLYAVATHQAIDALRRQQRANRLMLDSQPSDKAEGSVTITDTLESADPSAESRAIDAEVRKRVRESVDQLPAHLKPVVIMSYFQSLKHKEIADALSIPVGTVKSRLFTAIRLLHEKWSDLPCELGRS